MRVDQFLAAQLPEVSRARVQRLIAQKKIEMSGAPVRASRRLRGGETIRLLGPAQPPPLKAVPENIALDIVYQDEDLAVVNKPAGMLVHAGAGRESAAGRSRGTLVNALLHHFRSLSALGGELRPGIVHRLDRDTSGLMVVAKNDAAHQRLARQFAQRQVKKTYVALVHGWMKSDEGKIAGGISRDRWRRRRMRVRRSGGRAALSHYRVRERMESRFGKFSLLEVGIETGRTHQIRAHLASLGHPVVGDTLYGAPRQLRAPDGNLPPQRNFLHAAAIQFRHPRRDLPLAFERPLPPELERLLACLRAG